MNYLRKELYKLIKSDESIFDFIQESSLDGLWYWDLENMEEEWMNPKFWTTLGYDPAKMPHKAAAWQDIIFPEDLALAVENIQKHLADPTYPYNQEVRYRHKNGSTVWIRCRGLAIRDKSGKPTRVLGAHTDITQLKRKEQLLLETNRVARVGAWELNLNNNKVFWSDITKEIHEVTPDFKPNLETGVNFYKEGKSRKTIAKCIDTLITTGKPFDVELQIITAKNKEIWVRAIGHAEFQTGECKRIFGVFQDIEKRKQSESKLREREEQFRQIFENAVVGMTLIDKAGKWIKVNDSFCELIGYSRAELLVSGYKKLVHPDDLETSNKELTQFAKGEIEVYLKEKRYIHKKGHLIYFIIGVSKVVDENGRIKQFVAQYSDITERKLAEQKLLQSELQFRQTFEHAVIGMALVDKVGKWIKVNDSFCELVGYSRIELLDMGYEGLSHPDNVEESTRELEEFEREERTIYLKEKRYVHKKGHNIWLVIGVSKVTDEEGNILHYVAQFSDVTERKLAAQKLLQSERLFRQTFENAIIGLALVNKEGEWMTVNDSFCQLVGYSRTELEKMTFRDITHPDSLNRTLAALGELVAGNRKIFLQETRFVHKNGKDIWLIIGVSKVTDKNGKVIHYVAQYSDVTARKEAEEKAIRYSILDAKSKEMEQFTYIASHDLREPLTTIKGYLALLVEEFADDMPKDVQDILQFSLESANRMDELIQGLLKYSSLSQVKTLETVDCNKIIRDVVADLSVLIAKNKVDLEITELPVIQGHPLEMKLLFQNLISNAIKFRKKTIISKIKISYQPTPAGWKFKVSDNGIGIEKSEIKRIFYIFQRLHKQDYEGTGIGLANCKKIVELHNGEIWVDSILGKGSTFYFTILTKK